MLNYRTGAIGIMVAFFAAIFATVLLPAFLFNPAPTGRGNEYAWNRKGNPARGRQVYVREGCVYCHSQYTRLQDRGLGPLVEAGDYVNETPHQLGTARTGPDLTNEGGKHPPGWQKAHLVNPRLLKPGSIMPSFSYLSDEDLTDLVAYIEILGRARSVSNYVEPPKEYDAYLARKTVDTNSPTVVNVGHGLFIQNCSTCHGQEGYGNGPNSISMETKPSNFSRPFYKQYSDEFWFYRVTEGVPGSRMPRWGETLSETDRWYLVAYLKTLQRDCEVVIDNISQLDNSVIEMEHVQHEWNPAVTGSPPPKPGD
jgi:cbb3-type cytochrome oxidase cytochrome c subunit